MIVTKKVLVSIDPLFKNIDDKTFIRTCNKTGIEVEQIKRYQQINGLQIVKILAINNHPNADRLHLVKIQLEQNKELEIVCGANNLEINKYAIYAPVGTKFKDFEIQPKEIRGVLSEGMLLGYEELFDINSQLLSEKDRKGIILLDNAELGSNNIAKYLNNDDVVYELSLPSNRNDLNGILNFANEFKYAYNQSFDLKWELELNNKVSLIGFKRFNKDWAKNVCFIEVKNIKEFSLNWKQKELLVSTGIKINNNWLDLINLFSIYFGCPINIYNANEININHLELKTIDNEISFISNQKQLIAKPGMVGLFYKDKLINVLGIAINDEFKYQSEDKNILIEICNYNPEFVNKYNNEFKISSRNQLLSSKPLSSWNIQYTYNELINYLLQEHYEVNVTAQFDLIVPEIIAFDTYEMYNFLGLKEPMKFNNIFQRDKYLLHPSRLDIIDQYDVFEEALKIINVDNLKPASINFDYQKTDYRKYNHLNKIRDYLVDWCFYETKTYNLSNEQDYNKFNLFNLSNQLKIINPISKSREILRYNLIDEQLKVIKYNLSRKREIKNIFEIQNINSSFNKNHQILSMIIANDLINDKLTKNIVKASFINIKSLLMNAFNKININLTFKDQKNETYEYEQIQTILSQGQEIGYIFKFSKQLIKEYDLDELNNIYGVCIDLENLLSISKTNTIKPISNYPLVSRDVNVSVNDINKLNQLLKTIKELDSIYDCKVQDDFVKDNNHTYTLNITIHNLNKTLNSEEIDLIMDSVNSLIKLYNE